MMMLCRVCSVQASVELLSQVRTCMTCVCVSALPGLERCYSVLLGAIIIGLLLMQAQPVKQSLDEHEMSMRWRTRTGFHIKAHQKAYNARLSHHRTSKQKIGKITACVQWQVQGRRALGCVLSCLLTTAILLCNRTLRTCQAAQHMHLGIRQAPARSAHGHHSQAEAPVRHIPANANVWHALALPGPRHSLQPIKRQGEGTLHNALHAHPPCHWQQHLRHAVAKAWVPRPEIKPRGRNASECATCTPALSRAAASAACSDKSMGAKTRDYATPTATLMQARNLR